ncbi:MAG TPA: 2-amino-4-hydroxy-6-hydroxymethyldihydropteridine diphosphokinase [Cellulomonadaceae bacterium]|nr:2-amino-4-hydroxy-6-hydroxymethyldihydropteridine diphosphokinase [Cellulomonadaceae bacterium]
MNAASAGHPGPALDSAGRQLDQVRLVGISAIGHHGVFEHERREGQTFRADVVAHLDTRRAAATDDLAHTLHYGVLAEQIAGVLSGEPADLIETVAERIAATVLAHAQVVAVDVAVHKPQAPLTVPFEDVVVSIRRDRSKLPAAEPWIPATVATGPTVRVPLAPTPTAVLPVVEAAAQHAAAAPTGEVGGAAGSGPFDAFSTAGASFDGPSIESSTPGGLAPTVQGAVLAVPAFVPALVPAFAPPADPPTPVPDLAPPASLVSTGSEAGSSGASAVEYGPSLVRRTTVDSASGPADRSGPGVPSRPAVSDVLDELPDGPTDVVLALGSNLGAPQDTLREAVAALAEVDGLEVVQVSPLARSAPVGGPEQPDYLNAIVLARTTLAPRALLRVAQAIEAVHGRERVERWGPRTLDIDLIVYGSTLAVTDDLELPHPRAHERAFVLQPWAQIAPDAVLPGLGGGPVAALAATAPDRGGIRWLALDWLVPPGEHRASEAPAPGNGSPEDQVSEPTGAGDRPADATPAWLPRTAPAAPRGDSPTSWIP